VAWMSNSSKHDTSNKQIFKLDYKELTTEGPKHLICFAFSVSNSFCVIEMLYASIVEDFMVEKKNLKQMFCLKFHG